MNNKFKKIFIGVVASAMCVTGSMGAISASAYSSSESMILRNAYGAPGNVTSGNLKVSVNGSGNYETDYGFCVGGSSKVDVVFANSENDNSLTLKPGSSPAKFNGVKCTSSSYASFNGTLYDTSNEWGTWSVYHI